MASTPDQVDQFFASTGRLSQFLWLGDDGRRVAGRDDAVQVHLQKRLDRGGIISVRLDVHQLDALQARFGSLQELVA